MSENPPENRLKIVAVDNSKLSDKNPKSKMNSPATRRLEIKERLEKMWSENPTQFDPARNCLELERIARTFKLINSTIQLKDKKVADLGCGDGTLTRLLQAQGAIIDAVDISENALKHLEDGGSLLNITPIQDALPGTRLKDDFYDLVLCADVLGDLSTYDYRLFFSELSRIVRKDGYVVCSTPLDIYSMDALERFISLAEIEFKIEDWVFSYNYLYLRLCDFLKAPGRFYHAWRDPEYRQQQLNLRPSATRWWFRINSASIPACFWRGMSFIAHPMLKIIEKWKGLMLCLEKVCRFFWTDSGISHAIFIGIRKPLEIFTPEDKQERMPQLRKERKWE